MIQSLEDAEVGEELLIAGLSGGPVDCQRLRELGFCENAKVRKVAQHHLLVCSVCGTRLALDRRTARGILVAPLV